MNSLFSMDGPVYKICNALYYLMVLNFLWIIFSIPIVTCGASTTALFYVTGKLIRGENVHAFKDFWKSFKQNFKQSTIIWLIIMLVSRLLYINIKNINYLGSMAKFIYPLQIVMLIEICICTIYIFPIISRYNIALKDAFKSSLIIGNTHIMCTISCVGLILAIVFLFYRVPGLFFLISFSLYAYVSYWLIYNVFKKIMPQEKEIEENEVNDMHWNKDDRKIES